VEVTLHRLDSVFTGPTRAVNLLNTPAAAWGPPRR
jgi:hypothetical protein